MGAPFGFFSPPPARAPRCDFTAIPGISSELDCLLHTYGYTTMDALRAATDAALLALAGIGKARLQQIRTYLAEAQL
jgi:hypothetical protein